MRAFWQDDTVQPVVDYVSGHDDLTILVGAGASMEVGFPSWFTLVARVLRSAVDLELSNLSEDLRAEVVTQLLQEGPLAAATYAQTLLGDRLATSLAESLYREVRAPSVPGTVSLAVATLFAELGAEAELITTNYDDQLTRALIEIGWTDAKPVVAGRARRQWNH